MRDARTWQAQALEQLSQLFAQDTNARAFALTGSLADTSIQIDAWSDIDVKVVLTAAAVDRYYASVAWLRPFGQLIGTERHTDRFAKTLRVCLVNFQRFDLVFVPESTLQNPSAWDAGLFRQPCTVLWSKLPDLETQIAAHTSPAAYHDISEADLTRMADAFWFKAASAIGKVTRNDLLIGMHLALDLARDCLVLQMIRRDREKGTNIHRTGNWGNILVTRFSYGKHEHSAEAILDLILQSCEIFDELALTLLSSYTPRSPLLAPSIASARNTIAQRPFNF